MNNIIRTFLLLQTLVLSMISCLAFAGNPVSKQSITDDFEKMTVIGDLDVNQGKNTLYLIVTYDSNTENVVKSINDKTWKNDIINKKFKQKTEFLDILSDFKYFIFPIISENLMFYSNLCNGYSLYGHFFIKQKLDKVEKQFIQDMLTESFKDDTSLSKDWKDAIFALLDKTYNEKINNVKQFNYNTYKTCLSIAVTTIQSELKQTNGEDLTPLVK